MLLDVVLWVTGNSAFVFQCIQAGCSIGTRQYQLSVADKQAIPGTRNHRFVPLSGFSDSFFI